MRKGAKVLGIAAVSIVSGVIFFGVSMAEINQRALPVPTAQAQAQPNSWAQGVLLAKAKKKQSLEAKIEKLRQLGVALLVLDWGWGRENEIFVKVVGEVKNICSKPLRSVMVLTVFYDANHRIISREDDFIDLNPLYPGESSPFEIMAPYHPRMKTCVLIFKSLWGRRLKAVSLKKLKKVDL